MKKTDGPISWKAHWISRAGACMSGYGAQVLPAPYFRKEFMVTGKTENARCIISGLGYYELYLNGRKAGDHVLDPAVTIYDKRVRYVVYDVTDYLVPGVNVAGVILGNGWYNAHTAEVWGFDKAPWRDYPKFILQLETDDTTSLISDDTWNVHDGPIVFDGLRNGETYDARRELGGWLAPGYDVSSWKASAFTAPPGGILQEQTMPPCKVMRTLPSVKNWTAGGGTAYDFGQNLTGWVRITVSGNAGDEITIRYSERLTADNDIERKNISTFIKSGDCQTDRYILKGGGDETWEPRFTYHGFRYALMTINGSAKIVKAEARVVHTAFSDAGTFESSDAMLNRLFECTRWSYIGNFTGIPTDCPHREKNGWTGDAQLAAETGLYMYDAAKSYDQWMDSFADAQRPSGQLPGIVPSGGWGYNWGSGPAWDSAFILIPWYVYLFTGGMDAIRTHYDAMKRYVDYCTHMSINYIVSFGLGDWCHVDNKRMVETALISTAYYYIDALLLARFAALTERTGDALLYRTLAEAVRRSFNERFYHGGGRYAKGEQTALAVALSFGLADDGERKVIAERLAEAVRLNGCRADFGIIGAKHVPRALAENGYVDLAYRVITQEEYPGWMHWLKQGATTLHEDWQSGNSLNHIMFGDVNAWMFRYLAGIIPDETRPGFRHVILKPNPAAGLQMVQASRVTSNGTIWSSWKRKNGTIEFSFSVPENTTATIILPDGQSYQCAAGTHHEILKDNAKA